MRIGIQAWGSEGDLRPFLALGGALVDAGHDVTAVLTDLDDRTYESYERTLGVRVRMVARPGPARRAELDHLGRELIARNPFEQGKLITARLFRPAVPEMFAAARQLCSEVDLVVGHFFHHPVRTAAEAAGIPEVSVTLAGDLIASASYAPTGVPSLGPIWNRAWWWVAERLMNRAFLPDVNALRREVQLPPLAHMRDAWRSRLLDLVAVSPALCPPQPDWDPRHRVTGPFVVPRRQEVDTLPRDIESFVSDREPPIFVGFGSLMPKHAQERVALRRILEEALERTQCHAIVQGLTSTIEHGGRALFVQRASHAALFPRCRVVVHHGGAGTTQSAVRAGVPSIVVPHVADQFYWADVLRRRGVAPGPIPRLKLTARRLALAIGEADKPAMRMRAKELQSIVADEHGTREAVRLIESIDVARGGSTRSS